MVKSDLVYKPTASTMHFCIINLTLKSLGVFNNDAFPNVKVFSCLICTPEASSAHSERHFSGGKLVLDSKHNRLGSNKVCLTLK